MATFLSPGVYSRLVEVPTIAESTGPIRAAFVGTTKKGPMNVPILTSNPQQFLEIFGEPFPDSYLGYSTLAFFEEGNQAYIMRVGIEAREGQPDSVSKIAIDTSGARIAGWGRVPIFSGIDIPRIKLRGVGTGLNGESPLVQIRTASITNTEFVDANLSTTDGETEV